MQTVTGGTPDSMLEAFVAFGVDVAILGSILLVVFVVLGIVDRLLALVRKNRPDAENDF